MCPIMTPRRLYSAIATAEMITWALLIAGIVLKYTGITPLGVKIAGPIHGFTFLTYGAITILIWINNRWSVGRGMVGLLSTIIPFATVPFERNTEEAGLIDGDWRFRDPAEHPAGVFEHILALVVRRPALAALIIFVLLVVVFTVLLILGPPYQAQA